MKHKNISNQYYIISNPNIWNEHTGFFCINPRYYQSFDKDFLFDWINPKTGEHIHKILSKEYVLVHAEPGKLHKYDKGYINREYKDKCYRISLKNILAYK